mgnify:CR=1 FL=1
MLHAYYILFIFAQRITSYNIRIWAHDETF